MNKERSIKPIDEHPELDMILTFDDYKDYLSLQEPGVTYGAIMEFYSRMLEEGKIRQAYFEERIANLFKLFTESTIKKCKN